ncbi:transcriptional regulator with XRE-family HTH domain [Nocardia sp. GAS34]|uniref:MmyB family transcriptional regulator n=1 Tax=unclassified Nocardia TaxID=2637762 RepID=UPI003D25005A
MNGRPNNRKQHPVNERPVARMPALHHYLRQLRDEPPKLSRKMVFDRTGISEIYLRQLEKGDRHPSAEMIGKLIAAYQLSPAQVRYIHELLAPAIPLVPRNTLRDHLDRTPVLIDQLSALDVRGVLAVYTDPIGSVLAMNKSMSRTFAGLEETGNMLLWWLGPTAKQIILDWEPDTDFMVGSFKVSLGRHRTSPAANHLFRDLRRYKAFTQRWLTSTFVAYDRATTEPLRLRRPFDGAEFTATIHRTDITDSRQIILHTLYPTLTNTALRGARTRLRSSSLGTQGNCSSNSCTGARM